MASSPTAWDRGAVGVAVFVLTPLASIVAIAFAGGDALAHHAYNVLFPSLRDTVIFAGGVLSLTLVIGVGAAWIVSTYQFPGRSLLGWALVLPFAIPTYISAYAFVEVFDYFGPLQSAFRSITGYRVRSEYWFPEVRSMPGAVIVTSVVLYPYVYVASRAGFVIHGASLIDAARSLGCSRPEALRRVVLPVIGPLAAAGATLVLLEALNDIGASQYLGVSTLTVAVYSTWLNKGDIAGAAQIALLTLSVVLLLLWIERALRSDIRRTSSSRVYRPASPARVSGLQGAALTCIVALPVLFGFVAPFSVLLAASYRQAQSTGVPDDLAGALGNTLIVSAITTMVVLFAAVILAFAKRFTSRKRTMAAVRVSGIGYAVPGTVLVIGLLPALGFADRIINDAAIALGGARVGLVLSGSVLAIIMACTIRFLAIGIEQAETGLAGFSRNIDYAAQTLGCAQNRVASRILIPALRPVVAGAAVLVFVDALKELPATLLLRPLNFDTLATQLYGHASRGSFEDGAIAAILIVAAGLLPLVAMNRLMDRR